MFTFELKQTVKTAAGALGTVVGRAEYGDGKPNSYLVRFTAEPQREDSFAEGQLTPERAEEEPEAEPAAKPTSKGKK